MIASPFESGSQNAVRSMHAFGGDEGAEALSNGSSRRGEGGKWIRWAAASRSHSVHRQSQPREVLNRSVSPPSAATCAVQAQLASRPRGRRAVDDEELGPPQATPDEIVERAPPGIGALAAHGLDRQQDLLAIGGHADDGEQRDRDRLAVEPHAHHGAIENQPHNRLLSQ